jgi:glycosyltransferase involved in cell wall biosynthesis
MAQHRPTICQLLHTLNVGGAEVLAARLARRLRDRFRFLLVCLDELGALGKDLAEEGFHVTVVGRRQPGVDWRCAWRLGRLLRREGVGLIHAHQYGPFFYALAARLLYRRPPVLFTEHGRDHPDHPRRKRIVVNQLLLRRRDRVVGVGEAVRQALIHNEGIPAGRVEVLYNGVDLSPFGRPCADRAALRREVGAEDGDFVIFQVARLDRLKDHATAVRALARLVPRLPRARLVLVGEGPERGPIEELVRRDGLGAHVRLLGLRKDVARLLPAADLFLLTSVTEGIPLTVIEAMGAGLPVVATRVGGMTEVVEDGGTGLLAPAGDDGALAEQVLRLAQGPALREEMGRLGRARAAELFSEERMLDGYVRLYREMLGA